MNFQRLHVITALFACLCLPAAAQIIDPDVPAAAPITRDVTFLIGSSFNPSGSPKSTLDIGLSYQISVKDSVALQIPVSFHRDATSGLGARISAVYRPEYVREIARINGTIPIYSIVGVGAELKAVDPIAIAQLLPTAKTLLSGGGTNVGYNGAGGVGTAFHIGKLELRPTIRAIKGSVDDGWTYVAGVQFAWKFKLTTAK